MRHDHNAFRNEFEKQIRRFVNRYLRDNKNADQSVLSSLGIKQMGKKRRSRSAIATHVDLMIKAGDGCRVKFYCRQPNHDGAASLHPEANAVEIRYALGTKPVDFTQCPHVIVSTKAHVWLNLEPEMAGKNIYAFARWVNLSNANLSGPYGNMRM